MPAGTHSAVAASHQGKRQHIYCSQQSSSSCFPGVFAGAGQKAYGTTAVLHWPCDTTNIYFHYQQGNPKPRHTQHPAPL